MARKTIELPKPVNAEGGRKTIVVNDPNLSAIGTLELEIKGTAPLIQCAFSEKAKRMMLEAQCGAAKKKKAPKVPEDEFLNAMHCIGEKPKSMDGLASARFGHPAVAFKHAMIRAAKASDVAMTDARGMFFIEPDWVDLVEIRSERPPVMREDYVRITNVADIRIRPMFEEWGATLRVRYNARMCTAQQLVSWAINAGMSNGVGEWRPNGRNSTGVFGTFAVVSATAEEPKLKD